MSIPEAKPGATNKKATYDTVSGFFALPPETVVCLKAVKNAVFRSILSRFMSRNQVVSRFRVPAPVPDKFNL